eukprot:scaffold3058_cov165-Ochromonas_danica.AAC.30
MGRITRAREQLLATAESAASDDWEERRKIEQDMKDMAPLIDSRTSGPKPPVIESDNEPSSTSGEELFRKYPFTDKQLPILTDCDNYYSGKYGDNFWLQNNDQVYVYIPVDKSIPKNGIKVNFEAKKVTVYLRDQVFLSFDCNERIIPDGSFWLFEEDKDGQRYLQLDLEKRFRMINWKGVFDTPDENDPKVLQSRAQLLERLFNANKGLSKLTGMPPETVKEMMSNPDVIDTISAEVQEKPSLSIQTPDGQVISLGTVEEGEAMSMDNLEVIPSGSKADSLVGSVAEEADKTEDKH